MGFSITCLPFEDVEGAHLNMEANYLLEKHVSVDECGSTKQMMTQLDTGMKNPHGWVVYARNVNDKAVSRGVPRDAMVGVMVVSASENSWARGAGSRGASCSINVLGVHDAFRKRGVAHELWLELLNAIKSNPVTSSGKFQLNVWGAKCLNSPNAKRFYLQRGFAVANDSENLIATLEFVNGVPVTRGST